MCTSENTYTGTRFTARTFIDPARDKTTYRVRLLVTDLHLSCGNVYHTVTSPMRVAPGPGKELLWYSNAPADMAIRISGIVLPKDSTVDIAHVLSWYPLYSHAEADIISGRILTSLRNWDESQIQRNLNQVEKEHAI